jgi:hypothetical protein
VPSATRIDADRHRAMAVTTSLAEAKTDARPSAPRPISPHSRRLLPFELSCPHAGHILPLLSLAAAAERPIRGGRIAFGSRAIYGPRGQLGKPCLALPCRVRTSPSLAMPRHFESTSP